MPHILFGFLYFIVLVYTNYQCNQSFLYGKRGAGTLIREKDKHEENFITILFYNIAVYVHILSIPKFRHATNF